MPKRGFRSTSYRSGEQMESVEVPKRITKSFLTNFDLGNTATLGKAELEKLIKSAYRQLNKNLRNFRKTKEVSPAFEKYYGNDGEEIKNLKFSEDWSLRKRQFEFQRAVTALRAKTITVEGAKQYWEEEEKRIFGKFNEEGELIPAEKLARNQHMSENQRKRYWAAYEAFMETYRADYSRFGSNRIQQTLAQSGFWRKRKYRAEDLLDALNKLEAEDSLELTTSAEGEGADSDEAMKRKKEDAALGNVNKI